jgi:Tfp pilus assembly protein PilX
MRAKSERGIALILTLILLLVLSVMAVSLMFIGRSETWSSMNYRMMTQARYGAEAGINAAANWIQHSYTAPTTAQMTSFTLTTSPVTTGTAGDVVLSANSKVPSTYPVSAVQSSFASAATGTVTAGNTIITYSPSAKLLGMESFLGYPSATTQVVQKWEITSEATINGVRNADVQVSAIMEQQKTAIFAYAAFADAASCGALSFGGGGTTNSYDSSTLTTNSLGVATAPSTFSAYGGNVGTNGNLSANGSTTTINGTLSTPRTGTGSCSTSAMTALSANGNASVTGGLVELPQAITHPTPPAPTPTPSNTAMTVDNNNPGCSGFPAQCSALPSSKPTALYITAGSSSASATQLGAVAIKGDLHLVPPAGTTPGSPVYINAYSLTANGNPNIYIDPIPGTNPAQYAQIVVNVAAAGTIDLTGSSLSNPSLVPADFQILYGGTNRVTINGGSQAAALVYAPNADFKLNGGGNLYGAVIANQITDLGGGAIHYDRKLQVQFYNAGNYMLSSFNWQKY